MVRKESSMFRPALLDLPMKNGAFFRQPSETPDRLFFRSAGQAISQSSSLKELFYLLTEALHGVVPYYAASLALRTAEPNLFTRHSSFAKARFLLQRLLCLSAASVAC
jgi:hypothetical protein